MFVGLRVLTAAACLSLLCGCANHFKVVKVTVPGTEKTPPSEDSKDVGFQYALPEPYLIITNAKFSVAGTPASEAKPGGGNNAPAPPAHVVAPDQPAQPQVTATVVYLPSNEKYAVKVKSGIFGTFKGSLTLQNGWMLTALNQEYDTKGTETMTALAGLLGTALKGPFLAEGAPGKPPDVFLCMYKIDLTSGKLTLRVMTSDTPAQTCTALLGHP
ncbi:MAG TPA: hypothetical protein VHZ55_09835 [Bryobacteraceae bacterium]|nr:hypothetical protein [Bryobacteraceae bacterium]